MARTDSSTQRVRLRRLLLLFAIVAVLVIAGGGLYMLNKGSSDANTAERLEQSKQAFEEQDYEQVLFLLENLDTATNTIPTIQNDPEALYRYVQARREVELEDGRNIALLFPALRQVVMLDPNNIEAGELLLQIQIQVNRVNDALATSTRLIEVHPGNTELLKYRAAIYERLDRNVDALADVWAVLDKEPLDVRIAADAMRLTQSIDDEEATERFVEFADAQFAQHPDDPRAILIHGQSLMVQDDRLAAQQTFLNAAKIDPPDEDFAEVMSNWLERIGRFEQATEYLQQHAPPGYGNRLGEEMLYRSYQQGQDERVLARYRIGSKADAEPAADLLALTARSARRLGEDELANQLRTKLQAGDAYAKSWASVLDAIWQDPSAPEDVIDAADRALKQSNANPYLTFIMGEALIELNEFEAAIAPIQNTASIRTGWAQPRYLLGDIALRFGEPAQATSLARAALLRESRPEFADLRAAAESYLADVRSPEVLASTVRELKAVQSDNPGAPRTLMALFDVYVRAEQRAPAMETLRDAAAMSPAPSETVLIELARRADAQYPELARLIRDRAEQVYGPNAQIALDRAIALANAGNPTAGLALFREQTPEDAGVSWKLAQVRYMSYVNSPDAAEAWIALAEEYPDDLQVQTSAVQQIDLNRHQAFSERAIVRMRNLGGDRSVAWRIARARLILGDNQNIDNETLDKAATLIDTALEAAPNRADAQRLKSRIAELQGDMPAAITAMRRAVDAEPNNLVARYRLGQLQHQQREYSNAAPQLLRVARAAETPSGMRVDAMLLLARQGITEPILPIAQKMVADGIGDVRAKILLIELYQVDERPQEARELADQLMQNPTPEAISFLAEFFQRTNQYQLAERAIAMLDTIEMPQSERSAAMAIYAARQNDRDAALLLFRQAAEAEPDDPARWRTLIAMDLLFAKPDQAIADAQNAQAAGVQDPGVNMILQNQDLFRTLVVDVRFSRLAASIINDEVNREAGMEALKAILQAAKSGTRINSIARDIQNRALANENFLPLQITAIQLLMQAEEYSEAADLALETMTSFPNDIDSARLAAINLMNLEDWRRASNAAAVWSDRAPEFQAYADTIIASAQRQLGRPAESVRILQPYVNTALQDPQNHFDLLSEYALSLAQSQQLDQAWALMNPRLADSTAWRQLAAGIAARNTPTAELANQWLEDISAHVPAENTNESLLLAQYVYQAGDRLNSPALLDRAHRDVEALFAQEQAPAQALLLRAVIAESRGRLDLAEQSYRQLLQINPKEYQAMNNLAMVLIESRRNTDEAIRLAKAASAGMPNEPNFLDTLAQAQLAAGQLDAALASVNKAIDKAPDVTTWYLTKADILEAKGEVNPARILRERYQPQPADPQN